MARNRRPRIYDQEHSAREGEPVAVQVVAYDRNPGDTLTYRIVSGNGDGLFQIDPLTGIISRADGGAFDFETDARRYDLRVRVTDDGNPPKSRTADVTIRITDVNDAPHQITVSNLSVDENADGAVIGTVSIADQDDDSHTITVDDPRFEVVGGVLRLKAGQSLDHETDDPLTVTITASDDDDGSLSQSFVLTVNDLNEAPTGLALSNATVDENAAGATVGTITVADPDDPNQPFGSHTMTVDDARFEVVDGVLKLKDGQALDHEAADLFAVTVTATDGGGASTSQVFDITVNDANEAPTAIGLSNTSVDEGVAGAVVGTVIVTDPDDPSQPFGSHAIAVDDGRFEVVGGTLKLKDGVTLDHESVDQIAVTITATDGAGVAISQVLDIAVTDVNEAPTAIGLSNSSVGENDAGAVIGTVTVTDPDDPAVPFGTHSISVNDARFEVVDGVLKLRAGIALDHEAQASIPVIVTAIDAGGASVSQSFDIGVTDANDAPTSIALSAQTVDEATPGATIRTVLVTDPDDLAGTHDITVSDTRFEVIDGVLKLKDGVALDFAAGSTVFVNVTATDSGGLSLTKTQAISVNEIDEAPVLTVTTVDSVAEEEAGAIVGQVSASDPDWFDGAAGGGSGSPTFAVDDPRFEIVWGELKLRDGVALDFETEPTVTLTITATDQTGLSDSRSVTIDVRDVLEGKTFFSLDALDGGNGFRMFDANAESLGFSVRAAGDVNGDGFDDVIVGAPDTIGSGSLAAPGGASYVLFGGAAGFPADIDLSLLDGSDGFRIDSGGALSGLGVSVSAAGDVNGDGIDDLVIGAVTISSASAGGGTPLPPQAPSGATVVFGKTTGWSPTLDVSTLDGSDGFRVPSGASEEWLGSYVASVGDMNGDGYDDVAIGDLSAHFGGDSSGASYVVFGRPTGWPAEVDETALDGSDGFRVDGVGAFHYAARVGSGGDVNGDGYDDLFIGSLGYTGTASAYVLFGQPAAFPATSDVTGLDGTNGFEITGLESYISPAAINIAGDVNGDGIEDLVIGAANDGTGGYDAGSVFVVFGHDSGWPATLDVSALDGTNGFRVDGTESDLAGLQVNAAGDVNGDGFDDIVIGAFGANGYAGGAYVVYGDGGGFAPALDLGRIDGFNGFRIDGIDPGTYNLAGYSVDGAGDLNGDGFDDLVIGAPEATQGTNTFSGEAYVFFGGDFTAEVTTFGTAAADTLAGSAAADVLVGAQGDDTVIGAGGADVLNGGAGNDVLAVSDLSFARIDGGLGTDTLRLDGAGQSLDLTATGDTVIQGIERIDLTGSGDNALTLGVTDLLAMSDEGNDLFVQGDAGDLVDLAGDWRFDGSVTVDGVAYNQFGMDGVNAALFVEDDVVVPGSALTLALSNAMVDENADGAAIGTLTVADAGVPAAGYAFAVDDPRFEVVDGVLKLKAGQSLDHEAEGIVSVTVSATNGFSVSQAFNIAVTDVNEAPSIAVAANAITEESPGSTFAQVTISDPDSAATQFGKLTITLDDNRFELRSRQLKLKDGESIDFETEPEVTLTITVVDDGGLSTSETVTFPVVDILEGQAFISLAGLDGSNGVTLAGTESGSLLGFSANGVGDVNGDGFDDVIVTAPYESGTGTGYVVFGSAAGWPATIDVTTLDGSTGFRVDTGGAIAGLGVSANAVGDVNGDGIDDLLVSAVPYASTYSGPPTSGSGFVVFGKTTGWTPSVDLSTLDGSDGVQIAAGPESAFLGWTVAGAGDINGDGFDDVVLGNPTAFPDAGVSGGYVVFGQASGWSPTLDVSALDGSNGFGIDGVDTSLYAITVGQGGDFNGDGFDDLTVSYGYLPAFAGTGPIEPTDFAYVVFGRAGWTPSLDVSALQGGDGVLITGLSGYFAGPEIGSAGDVNGDGIEDIIIASPNAEANGYGSGSAFVVFGRPAGWPDTLDVSTLDGTDGFRIDGRQGNSVGEFVGAAGDVNGDGIDDFLISGSTAVGWENTGATYVVYGRSDGFDPVFDIGAIDGVNGFRLDNAFTVGQKAAAAGDVDGDGFDDLIIGAPNAGEGGLHPNYPAGEGYIVFGGDFTAAMTSQGTEAADTLTGTAGADSLVGAQGDDVLEGAGGADVLYGGSGDDILAVGDIDFSRIDGGSGTDTLRLDGAGRTLDLTAVGDAAINGIERLDLTGSGDNSVTLAITDLLKLSDESNTLFVAGDAGDQVTLTGDWRFDGSETVDGAIYNVFSVDGVQAAIYVEDDVVVPASAATIIALSGASVVENADGAAIGALSVSNASGPVAGYAFTVDDPRFEVVDGVLKLRAGQSLDHEAAESVAVTVTATNGFAASQTFDIVVADMNEAPTSVSAFANPFPEETPGAFAGFVRAVDLDDGAFGDVTFTVDDPRFEIIPDTLVSNAGQLKLKDGIAVDFETEPMVTVTITATDGGGLTVSETATFPVTDIVESGAAIALSSLDGGNGARLFSGAAPDGGLGTTVTDIGDVNGDGFADVAVGTAVSGAYGATDPGASYVLFGSASGVGADVDMSLLDGSNGFAVTGAPGGTGATVAAAGDINGDGLADIFVSVPSSGGQSNDSYVVFGKAAGWTQDLDLTTLDGSNGFRVSSQDATTEFGASVSAGDVNGDGLDDLIISDPNAAPTSSGSGVGHVIFGRSDGWSAELDLAVLDGTNGFRIDGGFGGSDSYFASAGDLNGDGFGDIVIASIESQVVPGQPFQISAPASRIVFGAADGWTPTVDPDVPGGPEGSRIVGMPGGITDGSALFGANAVQSVGDVNGDGLEDLVYDLSVFEGSPLAFVLLGNDGAWPQELPVDPPGGTGFYLSGDVMDFVGMSVSAAGDVNGDGLDDLIVGALSVHESVDSLESYEAGGAYVVYGRQDTPGGMIEVSQLDPDSGFRIDGAVPSGLAGSSVSAAGDVDGDGFDDLLVGAPASMVGGVAGAGEAYILYGDAFNDAVTSVGSDLADTLAGTAGAESLIGAQGDDVIAGNGGADVLYGGAGNDILAVGDLDFSRIDGGSGTDTLQLDGAGQSLDLTAIGDTVIEGVERLDLTGSGDNSVTLAITDLLNISDESNDLLVAGDQVTLVGSWQNDGAITVDGVTYNTFSAAGVSAALYVEDDIAFTTGV